MQRSNRYYRGTRITEPSYVAEPDWGGLELQRQEDFAQAERAGSIREDYQRDRLGLPTENERINNADNAARIQEIQAKAQFDAANFEKRYTAKQKAEISRLSATDAEIDSNPNFSESERIAAHRAVQMKKLGIKPADLPRSSPYAPGKGPGEIQDLPGIGKVSVDPNGKMYVLQGWKDSAEASAVKNEHEITKGQMTSRAQWETDTRKMIFDHTKSMTMPAPTADDPNAERPATLAEKQEFINEQRKIWGLGGAYKPEEPTMSADLQMPPAKSTGVVAAPETTLQSAAPKQQGQQEANSIIQEALANPEKMKDPTFAARARAARKFLGQ